MSELNIAVTLIKGILADLPPAEQDAVRRSAEKLRSILAEDGDAGRVALALVMAETEAKHA